MKKAALVLVLTVFALAATTALAQARLALRVDVPIGFSADGRHYSAGSYELRTINSGTIRLQNIKTGYSGLVMLKSPDQAKSSAPVLRFSDIGKRAWLTSASMSPG